MNNDAGSQKPRRRKMKLDDMIIDFIPNHTGCKQAYIRFEKDGSYLGAIDYTKKAKLMILKKWIDSIIDANEPKGTK